jgi:hypothetical protein
MCIEEDERQKQTISLPFHETQLLGGCNLTQLILNSPFAWSIEKALQRCKKEQNGRLCISLFMDQSLMYTIMITLRRYMNSNKKNGVCRNSRLKVPLHKYSKKPLVALPGFETKNMTAKQKIEFKRKKMRESMDKLKADPVPMDQDT